MNYELEDFFLEFKSPFKIAHGTRKGTDIVFLKLFHDGIYATGEASLPPYLPETKGSVRRFIQSYMAENGDKLTDLETATERLHGYEGNPSAKACIEIALYNLHCGLTGKTIQQLTGATAGFYPDCTFTLTPADLPVLDQKIKESTGFNVLKLKLGTENDLEFVNAIRDVTQKPLCADANQGWKNFEQAMNMIKFLEDKNVLFIEQPVSKDDYETQSKLYRSSSVPLYADESVQGPEDIDTVKNRFHGINVKLMKCGGLSRAVEMINLARKAGLKVMMGSMSETGCAISAAAAISTLADIADLDGPLLTKNNPYNNVSYINGKAIPV